MPSIADAVITPADFLARMQALFAPDDYGYVDSEKAHRAADELLWQTLKRLGYSEGVDFMENQELWYG